MIDRAGHFGELSIVLALGGAAIAAVLASGHAVLYKRDDRGTMMWVGLIWAVPIVGPALYLILGLNRIKRRALSLRRRFERQFEPLRPPISPPPAMPAETLPGELGPLLDVMARVTDQPLTPGNFVELLENGDAAYPAMLAAIAAARDSVALSTYIFEGDEVGRAFVTQLGEAARRGVEIRVLIDATGTLFARHSVLRKLRAEGIRYARFLPAWSMGLPVSLNLRNHRKILVVDGNVAFTGGMNLCAGHARPGRPLRPIRDLHFRVEGPVVAQLREAFAEDWFFTTQEMLVGAKWFPALAPAGRVFARGIADGPDENFEKSRWTILAAITTARRSLRILTPYFLPDAAIISALNLAAMRGVDVDIVLPSEGDVPFVQWASEAHWWQLLGYGCRIWISPPPFDHGKLFIVDDAWLMVGSSNWDPRSLRLNFEFNLECVDDRLAHRMAGLFDSRRAAANRVTLEEVNARPLPTRLRDGVARLFTPFL